MKSIFRTLLMALAALTIVSTAFGQTDAAGSKDYPGITRMPASTFTTTRTSNSILLTSPFW